ncbi:MAG: DUF1302 domain-containing protein [Betaproteobacteria bacterium]|nr:DUF1302 domain-containing protein [Rhodocyclales bacterium]
MKKNNLQKIPLALAISAIGFGVGNSALAFNFETEGGIKGSVDSVVSYGVQRRMKSPDMSIIGNDSGGNVATSGTLGTLVNGAGFGWTANPDFNYTQTDDGNLNYKKGDIVSSVLKGTHEFSLREEGNWAGLARVTWSSDGRADHTRRTPLDEEARSAMGTNATILDLWVSKEFRLGDNSAKLKFGNQIISWGEDIFIIGGINAINAVDLRKAHIPGTQVKEILLPAPILSFSTALGSGFSTEAYYQFKWNKLILDPSGTYWSSADFLGKGGKRGAFVPTSLLNSIANSGFSPILAGAGFGALPPGTVGDFDPTRGRMLADLAAGGTVVPVETTSPKNGGQYGINLRFKPSSGDTEYAAYYIRYHDKIPFVGFKSFCADVTCADAANQIISAAVEQYAENRNLYGVSMNTKLGDWAIGAELSYRPKDSVAIDPTVPFAGRYSLSQAAVMAAGAVAMVDGFVAEKKWQAHVTGFTLLPQSVTAPLGAAEGSFLVEAAVTSYPGLDLSGAVPYLLNNYELPSKTSWGYVAEFGLIYANIFNSGWTFSPVADFYHDVKGTSPNTLPFVEGRKALALAMNFDYHNKTKFGVGYTKFWGGGNLNMMRDRDVLTASVSYAF